MKVSVLIYMIMIAMGIAELLPRGAIANPICDQNLHILPDLFTLEEKFHDSVQKLKPMIDQQLKTWRDLYLRSNDTFKDKIDPGRMLRFERIQLHRHLKNRTERSEKLFRLDYAVSGVIPDWKIRQAALEHRKILAEYRGWSFTHDEILQTDRGTVRRWTITPPKRLKRSPLVIESPWDSRRAETFEHLKQFKISGTWSKQPRPTGSSVISQLFSNSHALDQLEAFRGFESYVAYCMARWGTQNLEPLALQRLFEQVELARMTSEYLKGAPGIPVLALIKTGISQNILRLDAKAMKISALSDSEFGPDEVSVQSPGSGSWTGGIIVDPPATKEEALLAYHVGLSSHLMTVRNARRPKFLYTLRLNQGGPDKKENLLNLTFFDQQMFKDRIDRMLNGFFGLNSNLQRGGFYDANIAALLVDHPKLDLYFQLGDQLWNYIERSYKERLGMSENIVKKLESISRSVRDRSDYLFVADKDVMVENGNYPGDTETPLIADFGIRGALTLVRSGSADHPLPLEIFTGFQVPREEGKDIIEIGRYSLDFSVRKALAEQFLWGAFIAASRSGVGTVVAETEQSLTQRLVDHYGFKVLETHVNYRGESESIVAADAEVLRQKVFSAATP